MSEDEHADTEAIDIVRKWANEYTPDLLMDKRVTTKSSNQTLCVLHETTVRLRLDRMGWRRGPT